MTKVFIAFAVLFCAVESLAQGPLSGANGDCAIGGQQAIVNGLASTGTQPIGTTTISIGAGVLSSYPNCSVAVFLTGTVTKASIYSNNPSSSPTPLTNPFTANADGSYNFFTNQGCYDITVGTGTGPTLPTSRTYSDVCLAGIGAGTVSSFQADQTVGSILTTSVANPTMNPFLHFSVPAAPPYTVYGNPQGISQVPTLSQLVTQQLPFTYSGNTLQLMTVGVNLSHVAGTPLCEDGVGNAKDSGCNNVTGVASFNGRTGPVTPQSGDYSVGQVTGAAPLASPNLSGDPTTPTGTFGDSSTQIANNQFVAAAVAAVTAPVTSVNGHVGVVVLGIADIAGAAPLASPAFTLIPTAPTAAPNTTGVQLATLNYVLGQAASATPLVDGTGTPGTSLTYARADHVHPTDTSRAATNNPNLTGNVQGPSYFSNGTTFTSSAGCSETALVGGAGAGQFTSGTTGTCTTTLTWGAGPSAPNHWGCLVVDQTTKVMGFVTGSTAGGVTVSVVTTSGDIVVVAPCEGY
jgi:hypothetical protein